MPGPMGRTDLRVQRTLQGDRLVTPITSMATGNETEWGEVESGVLKFSDTQIDNIDLEFST